MDALVVGPNDVVAAWVSDATQTVDAIAAHGAIYPLAQGWRLVVPPSVKPPDFAPGRYQLVSGVLSRLPDSTAAVTGARDMRRQQVTIERQRREFGGTTIGANPVRTDLESRQLYVEAAQLIAEGAASVTLQRGDGAWVTLTAAQFTNAWQAIRAFVRDCRAGERAHHEALAALATVEAIDAYDLSTGWPA
ncbi:MAG: hypothetical protein A3F74_08040 [Betaproteobacteria bacterium RIFCSPLOWO2_12_FULL_62_58]|nr:MAG: hypothetical protein A3F74_08040 [Betaproteobacteria bacterium RIFCSPLOWO2_12_FULL_62_58]